MKMRLKTYGLIQVLNLILKKCRILSKHPHHIYDCFFYFFTVEMWRLKFLSNLIILPTATSAAEVPYLAFRASWIHTIDIQLAQFTQKLRMFPDTPEFLAPHVSQTELGQSSIGTCTI